MKGTRVRFASDRRHGKGCTQATDFIDACELPRPEELCTRDVENYKCHASAGRKSRLVIERKLQACGACLSNSSQTIRVRMINLCELP
jgi:hypothetical protein